MTDSLALRALYDSTQGWLWSEEAYNTWDAALANNLESLFGVTVVNNRVVGLDLMGNNLNGPLPPEIGNLDSLRNLNLAENQITGEIPPQIGNLTSLTSLRLDMNDLSGSIPGEIGGLAKLQVLSIHNNQFSGEIPSEMGDLNQMQDLLLDANKLTGAVPVSFQNLSSASGINLADNLLSDLPDLSSLSLSQLQVHNNKLTFEDLEPNMVISSFSYSPQKLVGEMIDTTLFVEDSLVITLNIGGSANHYQWYRNSNATDDTTSTLSTGPLAPADNGAVYHLEVTSDLVPNLTLITREINLNILGDLPFISGETANDVTVKTAEFQAMVNPNYLPTTITFEYGLTTAYGITADYSGNPLTGNGNMAIEERISGLSPNTTYNMKVVAVNAAGTREGNNSVFQTDEYGSTYMPSTISTLPVKSTPEAYEITDYRMVGLPGNPNIPLSDVMTGAIDEQWIAYWDNGIISSDSDDYYVKYDGSSTFTFTRGRAFWIISMNDIDISSSVSTASLNASDEISIPLHDGWNLITNPFLDPVTWNNVQARNGDINYTLFDYDGTGRHSAIDMVPYQGYHVQNTDGLTELIIPYPTVQYKTPPAPEVDWFVSLRIQGKVLDEEILHFGISPVSSDGKDDLEYNIPRLFRETKGAWLDRPEWSEEEPRFASDYRPELGEIQVWPIDTYLPRNEEITLHFSGIEDIPGEYSVILVDAKALRSFDLRSDQEYRIISPVKARQFQFVVGEAEAVEAKIDELLPKEFALEPNYPNPFNPSTIIPVVLADHVHVQLRVYNILGKRVRTLHNGELSVGRHLIEWDGRNSQGKTMATGIYFVRMIAGGKVFTRKMILLK